MDIKLKGKFMGKFFKYLWYVASNLIVTFVLLAIFDKVYGSFETIVVALLALIYLSIQTAWLVFGQGLVRLGFALDQEFINIRKMLEDSLAEEKDENVNDSLKKFESQTGKVFVNGAFLLINYLIAILSLLGAL